MRTREGKIGARIGVEETHANRNCQLPNKSRPPSLLHHSRRGEYRGFERKTTCHRIWLNHATADFYSSLFLFSCFLWIHRALCATWDHIYRVGSRQVQSLEFLLLLGLFLLFVLPLLLWLPVLLLRVPLAVLHLELRLLRLLFFHQECIIFRPFCEYHPGQSDRDSLLQR